MWTTGGREPDLVFTANAALIWHQVAFLRALRHAARQGETPYNDAWFRENGFETRFLPEGWDFEGAGDALFCGETLFGGYLIRSDAGASSGWHRKLAVRRFLCSLSMIAITIWTLVFARCLTTRPFIFRPRSTNTAAKR